MSDLSQPYEGQLAESQTTGDTRRTYSPEQSADIAAKLAAKDADIERLMNTVVNCAKEMQLAASVTAIIGHAAESEIAQLRAALRETREVLIALYVARHDCLETEECVAIKAVLAKYAALAGEAERDDVCEKVEAKDAEIKAEGGQK